MRLHRMARHHPVQWVPKLTGPTDTKGPMHVAEPTAEQTRCQRQRMPPEARITSPVIQRASSDARKATSGP